MNIVMIGLMLALASPWFTSLGYIYQKRGVAIDAPLFKNKTWLIGFGLIIIGALFSAASLGLVDQTTLAPFSALPIMINPILSTLMLKEKFTRYEFGGTILIVSGNRVFSAILHRDYQARYKLAFKLKRLGSILAVSNSTMSEQKYSGQLLLELVFGRVASIAYIMSGLFVLVSFYHVCWCLIGHSEKRSHQGKLIVKKLQLLSFAFLAGFLSSLSQLCVKCCIEIVKTGLLNVFMIPGVFFFLGLPLSLAFQVRTLNLALKHFEAIQAVPIYESSVMVASTLVGGVVLNEFAYFSFNAILTFYAGIAVIISGIVCMMMKKIKLGRNENTKPLLDQLSTAHGSSYENC
mmetsp:Transcript_33288/g.37812  ORF Transcript_33288/g.37812 Transcript_33288/m.37812 type:complete len:348 (+) Transcript_33288:210-1253(+)